MLQGVMKNMSHFFTDVTHNSLLSKPAIQLWRSYGGVGGDVQDYLGYFMKWPKSSEMTKTNALCFFKFKRSRK